MPMAENRKSKDRSYFSVSRGQLFILAIVIIIGSIVFFFLGILIGQSIEERKLLQREEPVVKIPMQPKIRRAEEEMTFYDTLTGKTGQSARTGHLSNTPVDETARLDTTPDMTTTSPTTSWSVQVTAFQSKDDAERMASELAGQGYAAFVVSGQVKGKTWHRVRVGTYESKEEAMVVLKKLKESHRYQNAIITRAN